jgi:hypothetical protein
MPRRTQDAPLVDFEDSLPNPPARPEPRPALRRPARQRLFPLLRNSTAEGRHDRVRLLRSPGCSTALVLPPTNLASQDQPLSARRCAGPRRRWSQQLVQPAIAASLGHESPSAEHLLDCEDSWIEVAGPNPVSGLDLPKSFSRPAFLSNHASRRIWIMAAKSSSLNRPAGCGHPARHG